MKIKTHCSDDEFWSYSNEEIDILLDAIEEHEKEDLRTKFYLNSRIMSLICNIHRDPKKMSKCDEDDFMPDIFKKKRKFNPKSVEEKMLMFTKNAG